MKLFHEQYIRQALEGNRANGASRQAGKGKSCRILFVRFAQNCEHSILTLPSNCIFSVQIQTYALFILSISEIVVNVLAVFTVGLNVHLPKISFYEFKSYFRFWTMLGTICVQRAPKLAEGNRTGSAKIPNHAQFYHTDVLNAAYW